MYSLLPQEYFVYCLMSQKLLELEKELQQDDTQMPVYASFETPELMEIYESIIAQAPAAEAQSATEGMGASELRCSLMVYIFHWYNWMLCNITRRECVNSNAERSGREHISVCHIWCTGNTHA